MKKFFLTSIVLTACVALYAAVWPRSAEEGKVTANPVKPVVSAEIDAKPEEMPSIILSADNRTSEPEVVAENELPKTYITTIEEKTEPKIGSMSGEEPSVRKVASPQAELPEPEGEVIYIEFIETPEKNSTPPDYKPNTAPPAP